MRPFQGKACHGVMIKLGNLPVFAVVTFGAVCAVATFVGIVFLVAANTGHRRRFDCVVNTVASNTGGGDMRTDQLETGILVMVEIHRLPGCGRMAFGTTRASRSFVRIVFGVATVACSRRFADGIIGSMASRA